MLPEEPYQPTRPRDALGSVPLLAGRGTNLQFQCLILRRAQDA